MTSSGGTAPTPCNASSIRPSHSFQCCGRGNGARACGPRPSGVPGYREALLLRTLLNHPWLVDEHAEEIAALVFSSPAASRLRDIVLELKGNDISLDSRLLRSQLEGSEVRRLVDLVERAITHKSDKFAEPDANRAEVEVGWRHTLALHD